jgi:hypothetical protein
MNPYKIISYLTYPALWATIGVAILNPTPDSLLSSITASLILHSLIPLIFVIYLLKSGQTKSIDLPELSSRIKTVAVAAACGLVFQFLIISDQTLKFWNQLIFVSLLTQFIFNNLKFKISIHVMSITGFLAYFTLDQPLFFSSLGLLISLTSIALVAYSRFKVKAHTPIELIAGFTMGIAIVFINQWAYSLWR